MLDAYLPALVFLLVAAALGLGLLAAGLLLGPRRPDPAKDGPYECGFEPFGDARLKFDVRYYLVAILFIVFDLEIAFLFPWAVAAKQLPAAAFVAAGLFLAVLGVGFVYEWRKGALEWD
ncbi:MAG: NADH-quinone oxidoreductase subunit A [Gammaproteobacteria bacterium]|nr:MAG: NADH-quinone oxidoreductase subunit A [Gammaproteobacteria bacterium]